MPEAVPAVPGADHLVQWFGEWPSFHDAEVVEISLRREGVSHVRIRTWRVTSELDAGGYFILDRHAIVTISLEEITGLELADFSVQNIVGNVTIEPTQVGHRVNLNSCFGVGGYIEAASVVLSLEPYEPRVS